MAKVQLIQVGERAGQRLDNFLLSHLKGVPRSRVYRMIRSGEVRVNGSRRRPNTRLNKPIGVTVHGGSGESFGIAETLEQVFGEKDMQLAHRLDKATSGCLVIAKNRRTLNTYHSAFRNNEIKKSYDVLVEGNWPNELTDVDARIERFHLENGERRVRISEKGQRSRTVFEVVASCSRATWLAARPQTGRTHQIRIHTQFAEHPILGDRK